MLEIKLDLRPDFKKMLEIAFERNYSKSYASLEEFLADVLDNAVKNIITKEAFENKGFVISLKSESDYNWKRIKNEFYRFLFW